jgi:6,7-dimethyl-8-ribityllumazine synthase
MLKKIKTARFHARQARFAIVASKYNSEYVDAMLRAALRELKAAKAGGLQVVRVPGAYEIPVVAQRLASISQPPLSAIICLGVILRGETTHAQFIGEAVSQALMQIQLQHTVPVIHEVLLLENRAQAKVRCQSKDHNRGAEAAQTALAMAKVMEELEPDVPF